MKPASPYLTAAEAAAYLRFPNLGAFRTFLWRRRQKGTPVPTHRRDGTLLFKEHELDAALTVERPSRQLRAVGESR